MPTLLPTQFNPKITVAQEVRLIQIADTHVYIDLVLRWDHITNTWTSLYHAKRWTHSCISSTVHDLGVYENLAEAVNRICQEAGIKATDPQYQQKLKAKKELESALDSANRIKSVLGTSPEITALEQQCKLELSKIDI